MDTNLAIDKQTKEIIDFIYDKPQLVVPLLQQQGYDISIDTATLNEIYKYTFQALSIDKNVDFAQQLQDLIYNEGYANIIPLVIAAGASIVSSVIGGVFASDAAQKQREAMMKMKLAELASNERLGYEQIRTQAETDRLKIILNTIQENRNKLYEVGTKRLADTWMYVLAFGISVGILYGLTLLNDKKA